MFGHDISEHGMRYLGANKRMLNALLKGAMNQRTQHGGIFMLNQTIESTRQKRILVFLSIMHENGKTYEYSCPDGSYVSGGSLSSEAPIRYLIQHDRGIKNVICIVTDDASNAYSFVSSFLEKSGVSTTPIRFDAGMDFEKDVLPKVIDVISPNDEIYLETTGGFRDAVFKLNLLQIFCGIAA